MKALRFLGITLLMILCTVNFSSCSKDDDSSDNSLDINLLYGTWVREYKGYIGNNIKEVLVFKPNMTWSKTEYVNGIKESEEGYTFTYYKDARVLSLIDDANDYEPWGYIILELTNSTFAWLNGEDLSTYKRQ